MTHLVDILTSAELWLALICGLPFLGIISTSEVGDTTDGRAGATDDSQAATLGGVAGNPGDSSIQAGGGNVIARDKGISGFMSNIAGPGGVLNQGTLKTGTDFNGVTGGVKIETFSDDFAAKALESVTSLSEKTLASIAGSQEANNAQLAKLSESKATDGASSVNRNLVYVAIAALLAVLGFAWIIRR